MAGLNTGFPNAPFIDPATGDIMPVWRAFLLAVYSRTGAAIGVSSTGSATAITTETAARAAADITLAGGIAAEAAVRLAADTAEATARADADAALGGLIAALAVPTVNNTPLLSRLWFGRP